MDKRSTKQTQTNKVFQRIEESYSVPTYMAPNYHGETRPPQRDKPTKADLRKLIEQCRAKQEC